MRNSCDARIQLRLQKRLVCFTIATLALSHSRIFSRVSCQNRGSADHFIFIFATRIFSVYGIIYINHRGTEVMLTENCDFCFCFVAVVATTDDFK